MAKEKIAFNDDIVNCDVNWLGGSLVEGPTTDSVLHTQGMTGEVAWDVTLDVINAIGAPPGDIVQFLIKKEQDSKKGGEVTYYSKEGAVAAGDMNKAPRLEIRVFNSP